MPKPITAADIGQAARTLGLTLTTWQRDTLVAAYACHHRTGRWPVQTRRPGRATLARVEQQLAATA